ncbi:MAG TPA: hypothetical protein PKO15_16805, partial [Fibrobacteria bacterium]|nr:hypothetical protein [Fibrobacteria bacterium]
MMAPLFVCALIGGLTLAHGRSGLDRRPDVDPKAGLRLVEDDSTVSDGQDWHGGQGRRGGYGPHQARERRWAHPVRSHERWVEYDLSGIPGYARRKGLFLRLDSSGFRGTPHVEVASGLVGEPRFQGAFRVGEVLEIDAQVQPGDTVTMPIPLPDALADARAQDLQVVHLVDGNWKTEQVVDVRDGAAWTRMTSFSPVAVGLVQTPRALAAGAGHLLWVRQGRVWSAGANDFGQLGNQESGARQAGFVPVFWPRTVPVVAVAAGARHSLAMDSLGNVWAWGDNRQGQCGWPLTGPTGATFLMRPVQVVNAQDTSRRIVQIAAGDSASYAVTASGRLLSWGANVKRQLGRGAAIVDSSYEVAPKWVTKNVSGVAVPLEGVLQVAAGEKHALALLQGGSLWGWGANDAYQLGGAVAVGIQRDPAEVRIAREVYGADTVIASGCSGPDSTGCWSQTVIRPWYDPPSLIGAGGNSSYTKLFRTASQGLTAVNLVWGANDSGRILPGGTAAVKDPVIVSGRGQNMLELGRSHLLEAYGAGVTYYPAPISAALNLFPVFARGANLSRQSDPVAASAKVADWKEIVRSGQVTRMMAGALAAGPDVSAVADSRLDSVYVWGGAWGGLQTGPRTENAFVEIVSPQNGDTIPRSLDTVPVVWRRWTGATAGSQVSSRVVPTTDAQGRLVLTITSGAQKASVVVVRALAGPVAKPAASAFDRRQNQKPTFVLNVPYDAQKVVLQLWTLKAPGQVVAKSDLGSQSKGLRTVAVSAWTDPGGQALELRDGSYGVSVAFQFVGQKSAWDTLRVSQVGASETWMSAKLLSSRIPDGGPDSFQVVLPGPGVLAGYLRKTVGELPGVRVVGAWDLRDSGSQAVAGWNVSDSLRVPIHDSLAVSYFGWYYRSIRDGFRLTGGGCADWVGMNSTRVDPFQSEVAVERLRAAQSCDQIPVVRSRTGQEIALGARSLTVGAVADLNLNWFWPGSPLQSQHGLRALEWKTNPA